MGVKGSILKKNKTRLNTFASLEGHSMGKNLSVIEAARVTLYRKTRGELKARKWVT